MTSKIKIFLPIVLICSFFLFSPDTFATSCTYVGSPSQANSVTETCLLSGGSGQDCPSVGLDWFYKSACRTDAYVQSEGYACYNNRRVLDGSTGCTTTCRVGGEIYCSGVCKVAEVDDGSPTCAEQNKSFNTCTGACGGCSTGYELVGSECVELAPVAYFTDVVPGLFKGYTGTAWEIFLTVDNWIDQILESLIDELVNSSEFIEQLVSEETFITELTTNETFVTELTEVVGAGDFVGLSSPAMDGNEGSYADADAECDNDHAGSHVCTSEEMLYAYQVADSDLPGSGIAWYNSGSPTNIQPLVSDCKGWDSNAATYFATVWNFTNGSAGVQGCNSVWPWACCQ
ncbi:MAG: hypothetical protein ABH833_00970 [Parcubacteria group bacterium]|nr:hypothetical protein [Patescibacteria group bacterium]